MTDNAKTSTPFDSLRVLSLKVDYIIYFLLSLLFKIFFNIVNANIFDNEVIMSFYNRVQLLLGVLIIFKLSFSLVSGIVNPDQVKDSKKGVGNIIFRIVITMVMLTLLTPLSGIPESAAPEHSYNRDLKEQGILFGTLQSFQDRILSGNVLGKLILGVSDDNLVETNFIAQSKALVTTVVKGFININFKSDGVTWMCSADGDYNDDFDYETYTKSRNYNDILDLGTSMCDDGKKYKFSYIWGLSWVLGIAYIFVVASFCVDIAIRLIKLVILRLIAPIPIISYIDPKSADSGAFNSWVKTLTKTYLDLFVRIILIYFVVFICFSMLDMLANNLVYESNDAFINVLSTVVIWLGLFMFAKQAPKFFMDMFGIKGDAKGFFSGLGAIAGLGSLAAGTIASGVSYGRTSYDEGLQNGRRGNLAKSIGAGVVGATTGFVGGAWAGLSSKDNANMADEIRKNQQQRMALRASGVTFAGRVGDNFSRITSGRSLHEKDEAQIAAYKQFYDLYDLISNKVDTDNDAFSYQDASGTWHNNVKVKELKDEYERLKLSNASANVLKAAEDRYKEAQAARIVDRINTADDKDLVYQYYTQASQIASSHTEILDNGSGGTYNLTDATQFKIAHFHANDMINQMKSGSGRNKYNARKAISDANNNRR